MKWSTVAVFAALFALIAFGVTHAPVDAHGIVGQLLDPSYMTPFLALGAVEMQKVKYPESERQRKLQAITFSENQILTRDLPRDTVLKSLQFRLSGSVVTTFGSGTPVADAFSTFDNLISRIDVIVNGGRVVKSVRPHMMRMMQLMVNKNAGERASSAAAAAATDNYPTADGAFAYGTTTQVSTARETIIVPFEHIFCEPGLGREATWLNLKGVASAEVKLTAGAFSSLLGFGNTAPVVYSSSTFQIDIITREAQDIAPDVAFSDWKQTTKDVPFASETTDATIDINRGNLLSEIMLLTRNGAAGSATTATGKLASNLVLTKVAMKINGQTDIKVTDFKALHAENRQDFGINAALASNVSSFDGIALLSFLARKDLSTALSLRPPLVDNAQLVVSSNTASNTSYTNPCMVTLMTGEIVTPRA